MILPFIALIALGIGCLGFIVLSVRQKQSVEMSIVDNMTSGVKMDGAGCAVHLAALRQRTTSNRRSVPLANLFDIAVLYVSGSIDQITKRRVRNGRLSYVPESECSYLGDCAGSVVCLYRLTPEIPPFKLAAAQLSVMAANMLRNYVRKRSVWNGLVRSVVILCLYPMKKRKTIR